MFPRTVVEPRPPSANREAASGGGERGVLPCCGLVAGSEPVPIVIDEADNLCRNIRTILVMPPEGHSIMSVCIAGEGRTSTALSC